MGNAASTSQLINKDPASAFQSAMADAGLICPDIPIADGDIHRFEVEGDRKGSCNGWYILFHDQLGGAFGSWKTGQSETWSVKGKESMASEERQAWQKQMKAAKAKRKEEQKKIHAEARKKAQGVWQAANIDPVNHPYIKNKQITPFGIKQRGETLIIPLRDSESALHSLQFINNDGSKKFLTGGKVSGCYCCIGELKNRLYLCEGYATGATIYEVTGEAVVVAFNTGNLKPVAEALRSKYPELEIIISADNDQWTDGNPGVTKAMEAARAVNGKLIIPEFSNTENKPTDFNDLARLEGPEQVKKFIDAAQTIEETQEDVTPNQSKEDEQVIKELTALPPLEFDRSLNEKASDLGVRPATLEKEVKTARKDFQAESISLNTPEPWPETVNGSEVLNDVADVFNNYVVLPGGAAEILALWAAYTHAFEAFVHSPRLNITSPEKECGKTLLLDVIETLTPKAIRSEGITTAVLIRIINKKKPTILIDECDSFLKNNKELRGALNAGHKRGGQHLRCEGENNEIKAYKTFCPVALAGIRRLAPTLASRSIVIQLKRALKKETRKRFDSRHIEREEELSRKLARWAQDNFSSLEKSDPVMPPDLFNRQADNWRPLFSIAETAGPEWITRVKTALISLKATDADVTASAMLLEDIRSLFNDLNSGRVTSKDLAEYLGKIEERPWPEWGITGKPITTLQIARLLKPFDIKPNTHRFGDDTHKGYLLDDFKDAFPRYLDDLPVTPSQPSDNAPYEQNKPVTDVSHVTDGKVTDDTGVTDGESREPLQDNDCYRVTDETPQNNHVEVDL